MALKYYTRVCLSLVLSRGGGGHSQYILEGCAATHQKGGLRHGHNPKKGVSWVRAQPKKGVLGMGTGVEKGGSYARAPVEKGGS